MRTTRLILGLVLIYASGTTPAKAKIGLSLYLPVVSFPSLQGSISHERLASLRGGKPDVTLVLDQPTFDALTKLGVIFAPDTRVIPAAELRQFLWYNRMFYTLLPFDALTARDRLLRIDEQLPFDGDLDDYPFAFASDQPDYEPEKLTRVLLSGVTAITRLTADAFDQHGYQWAGDGIRDYVRHADYFHISNEVSFDSTCIRPPDRIDIPYDLFCTKDSAFPLLLYLGVNVVELTGNHNLDYGTEPYVHTLQAYRAAGIATIGGGETLETARQPLELDEQGNRIILLACNWAGPAYALVGAKSPGAAFCDRDWLHAVIPDLAARSDLLIVSVQYEEFTSFTPLGQQKLDFRELADLGADVVIGTQAHTPQTFEFHRLERGGEAFIHYGLGNLFFDQKNFQQRFFMDQLFIYQGRLLTVDVFTGYIEDFGRPRPMTDEERRYFLRVIFEQSRF